MKCFYSIIVIIVVLELISSVFLEPYAYRISTVHFHSLFGPYELFFGSDELGRSVLARVMVALRYSLYIGFVVSIATTGIAGFLGMIMTLLPNWLSDGIWQFIELITGIPTIIFALLFQSIMPATIHALIIVLIISFMPMMVLFCYTHAKRIVATSYVQAAQLIGVSSLRIVCRYIIPNMRHELIAHMVLLFSFSLLLEAALSFLGYGIPSPIPSLGALIYHARRYMILHPHLIIIPSLLLSMHVFMVYMYADMLKKQNQG